MRFSSLTDIQDCHCEMGAVSPQLIYIPISVSRLISLIPLRTTCGTSLSLSRHLMIHYGLINLAMKSLKSTGLFGFWICLETNMAIKYHAVLTSSLRQH